MQIGLLVTGSEILDGRVQDSNSNFLQNQLLPLGLVVDRVICCNDQQSKIEESLGFLADRYQVVIISGGLGPTSDDLTREAIASYCKIPLDLNPKVLQQLKEHYAKRKRDFLECNSRQAYFPRGADILPNNFGTAPGFRLSHLKSNSKKTIIVALPGVPSELHGIFLEQILPWLKSSYSLTPPATLVSRIFGLAEAKIAEIVESLSPIPQINVSYRASFPVVELKLSTHDPLFDSALRQLHGAINSTIGAEYIFSNSLEQGLGEVIKELMLKYKFSLSLAESCTAGMVGSYLANTPGASEFLLGGIIAYSNQLKINQLGVAVELIQKHGAVSSEVALEMATKARSLFKTTHAVSITGVAGPDGGTTEKPVGTFWVGIATPQKTISRHYYYPQSRQSVRLYATYAALNLLRCSL